MKIHVGFNELRAIRKKMGINELVEYRSDTTWRINRDIDLETEGIDIAPEEIVIEPDGLLSYEGRKILVYIRDQYAKYFSSYKFHVVNCGKIKEMKRGARFEKRYVASTRTDGQFWVRNESMPEGRLVKMLVCKLCLTHLNYKSYNLKHYQDQEKICSEFSPEEFFSRYNEATVSKPKYTDVTAPRNDYSSHKEKFSRICRERAHWKCEECGTYLGDEEAKKFLHAHHIDRDKSNNRATNLRALCVDCHDQQEGHSLPENMRTEFRNWKRRHGRG